MAIGERAQNSFQRFCAVLFPIVGCHTLAHITYIQSVGRVPFSLQVLPIKSCWICEAFSKRNRHDHHHNERSVKEYNIHHSVSTSVKQISRVCYKFFSKKTSFTTNTRNGIISFLAQFLKWVVVSNSIMSSAYSKRTTTLCRILFILKICLTCLPRSMMTRILITALLPVLLDTIRTFAPLLWILVS